MQASREGADQCGTSRLLVLYPLYIPKAITCIECCIVEEVGGKKRVLLSLEHCTLPTLFILAQLDAMAEVGTR